MFNINALKNISHYEINLTLDAERMQFLFTSVSENGSIIKAIDYSPITYIQGRAVYNLGFGDYVDGTIVDDVNSNNGDVYTVFNTVLHSIPLFFAGNPDSFIYVSGSDSDENFIEKCRTQCKKRCPEELCKNEHRRIRTYRRYIDKYFEELAAEYEIYGRIGKGEGFGSYVRNTEYKDILICKKK